MKLLFYVGFVCGLDDMTATFSDVDIVKYLPLTLKLGYFFLFFFNGKSLLMNVWDSLHRRPFVYGNKKLLRNSCLLIS